MDPLDYNYIINIHDFVSSSSLFKYVSAKN